MTYSVFKRKLLFISGLTLFFAGGLGLGLTRKRGLSLSDYLPYFPSGYWAILIYLVLMIIGWGMITLARMQKAALLNADDIIKTSAKKPILYLRSFTTDDNPWFKINPDGTTRSLLPFELQMENATKKIGPLIAIGNPNEGLPTLGASRTYIANDTWKEKFYEYVNVSQLIIITIDFTESVFWELSQLIQINVMDKVIIFFPFIKGNTEQKNKEWNEFLDIISHWEIDKSLFPTQMDDFNFLYFNTEGMAQKFKSPITLNYFFHLNSEMYYNIKCLLDKMGIMKYNKVKELLLFLVIIVGTLAFLFIPLYYINNF